MRHLHLGHDPSTGQATETIDNEWFFMLHLLGCFAASDSFVLDGLVNETGLHLGMENMIAVVGH